MYVYVGMYVLSGIYFLKSTLRTRSVRVLKHAKFDEGVGC